MRPPALEDFEAWAAFYEDDDALKYIGGAQVRSIAWRTFTQAAGAWALQGFGLFSVFEKATGQWIGRVGPNFPEGWPGTEVGWALVRSAWGRGYAIEAAVAAVNFAFDTLGWSDVVHCIAPENLASRRLAERLGSTIQRTAVMPQPVTSGEIDVWGQSGEQWRARPRLRLDAALNPMVDRPIQPSFGGEFNVTTNRRLLFAIPPDARAQAELTRLMERLSNAGALPRRPVDENRRHITLNLLGDFDDRMPPNLIPAARAAAEVLKTRPFDVALDRIVGNASRLLLRASDALSALHDYRQALVEALIAKGPRRHVEPAFRPHLTLAYGVSNMSERPIKPVNWTARELVLIESLLGKHQHIERGRWSIRS